MLAGRLHVAVITCAVNWAIQGFQRTGIVARLHQTALRTADSSANTGRHPLQH